MNWHTGKLGISHLVIFQTGTKSSKASEIKGVQVSAWKMLPGSQWFCDVLLGVMCVKMYCYLLGLRAEGRSYRKHCSRKTRKRKPNENWGILADFRMTKDLRRKYFTFPGSCHPLHLPGLCVLLVRTPREILLQLRQNRPATWGRAWTQLGSHTPFWQSCFLLWNMSQVSF